MKNKTKHPKVLLIAQQKGGVGKTTLARMLGVYAAREDLGNMRVLLIDLDFQASLSKLCLDMDYSPEHGTRPPVHPEYERDEEPDWNGRSSSADVFYDGEVVPYPVQYPYAVPKLDILPAHKARLQEVEEQDRTKLRERVHERLRTWANLPEVGENYDLLILDTGPKESPLVLTGLRAATHMVIPIVPERQCMDGMVEMMGLWKHEREVRPGDAELELAGIVINRFDVRYNSHNAVITALLHAEHLAPFLMPTILPQRAAITERDTRGARPATLFDLPPSTGVSDLALQVCASILGRVFPERATWFQELKPDRDHVKE